MVVAPGSRLTPPQVQSGNAAGMTTLRMEKDARRASSNPTHGMMHSSDFRIIDVAPQVATVVHSVSFLNGLLSVR